MQRPWPPEQLFVRVSQVLREAKQAGMRVLEALAWLSAQKASFEVEDEGVVCAGEGISTSDMTSSLLRRRRSMEGEDGRGDQEASLECRLDSGRRIRRASSSPEETNLVRRLMFLER